jgi:hypothetical protein
MKIIKLTLRDGDIVYLNTNCIVSIEPRIQFNQTLINTIKSDRVSPLVVRETPEEILALIQKA